ncbi:hypothetical protein FACS1894139_15570 [Planctomycetales bacterium]|nr:hypothetical protein FACS1894107_04720 [Planctomycetales bacterium]GHS98870.1 hypothetical protein FACS1894108_07790 [Planctomycetales bacterium]GHT07367.1 hypothetical protein FACS1894139_15570 [Planctomycetales bacterium]
MSDRFFAQPILNSPYECPARHWELDGAGLPTQNLVERRRRADFITPIPQARKRKDVGGNLNLDFNPDELSGEKQLYSKSADLINEVRRCVDDWRKIADPSQWNVTPITARLLQHWRHYQFSGAKPFFCQIEAAETVIWLTEVALVSHLPSDKFFLEHLKNAAAEANPELLRLALKMATGSGKTTVMAMLIAWQTLNAVRHPQSKNSPRAFSS